ncbi:unnamed protein product [Closterium sp. Naga37s-1]|nr:unnamed protein product [Closterium sp. Naga37s-1]
MPHRPIFPLRAPSSPPPSRPSPLSPHLAPYRRTPLACTLLPVPRFAHSFQASAIGASLPARVAREVARELKALQQSVLDGIRVIFIAFPFPSSSISPTFPPTTFPLSHLPPPPSPLFPSPPPPSLIVALRRAELSCAEGTPYEGGVFRMKLLLGRDFPNAAPKGFFLTRIFHPNVAKNGEICVSVLKKDWKATLGLKRVLLVVRCLLIEPYPESALNEDAGKLLLEDYNAGKNPAGSAGISPAHHTPLATNRSLANADSRLQAKAGNGSAAAAVEEPVAASGTGGGVVKAKGKGENTSRGGTDKKADLRKKSLRRL